MVAGIAPALLLAVLWAFYLSLVTVGGDFLAFQWDILLLEAGFLAIFLAPLGLKPGLGSAPPKAIVWLLRWLLFRLMFSSGAVKLLSGDPTWRDLTALGYHYWTQPLPTWVAWYVNLLPDWFDTVSCALLFAIELGAPVLIAAPQGYRLVAFSALVFFQVLIFLTGNYCFFNLLTLALCVLLLDDRVWPDRRRGRIEGARASGRWEWPRFVVFPVAGLVLVLSIVRTFDPSRAGVAWPESLVELRRLAAPFGIVNGYGLFAVMTTTRPEIILEGSADGETWTEYQFRWKPGALERAPAFVEPHQPRLDWQMWFAALAPFGESPWFVAFVHRLLEGSKPVAALLGTNPFPDTPPRYVRAVLYDYTFTDLRDGEATGRWWRRERKDLYLPAVSLDSFRRD